MPRCLAARLAKEAEEAAAAAEARRVKVYADLEERRLQEITALSNMLDASRAQREAEAEKRAADQDWDRYLRCETVPRSDDEAGINTSVSTKLFSGLFHLQKKQDCTGRMYIVSRNEIFLVPHPNIA